MMGKKYREFWVYANKPARPDRDLVWRAKEASEQMPDYRTPHQLHDKILMVDAKAADDWREQAEALYQRLQELQSEGMDNHGDKMAVRKYEQFKKEREDD